MLADPHCCRNSSRRAFLADLGLGFTGLALGGDAPPRRRRQPDGRLGAARRQAALRAEGQERHLAVHERRRVSHLETFDPKPALDEVRRQDRSPRRRSRTCRTPRSSSWPASSSSTTPTASSGTSSIPLQVGFKKYGQSGIEVSDWLPHVGECVDDLAVVRSMYTTDDNHGAQTQFHTGRHMLDGEFPTLGAWVHYGLGLAQRQPAAVRLDGQPRVLERQGRPLPRPGARRGAAARRSGQPARLRQARAAASRPTSSRSASSWSAG